MAKKIPASAEEYKVALETIWPTLPESYRKMLKAHYLHPQQTLTLKELQEAAGYKSESGVNLQYGDLGKQVLQALVDYEPTRRGHDDSAQWTMVVAEGHKRAGKNSEWVWILRSQVSAALAQLGWFEKEEFNDDVLEDLDDFDNEQTTKELKQRDRTQYEALRQSRIGQGEFRRELINHWHGKCAVTGVENKSMLRASHIKPWRDSNNEERLDKYNGLLLQPNLDAAFDACLISFADDGQILISELLNENDLAHLSIRQDMKLSKVDDQYKPYLAYHRAMFYNMKK